MNQFSALLHSNEEGEYLPPKKEAVKPTPKPTQTAQKKDVNAGAKKPVARKTTDLAEKPSKDSRHTGEKGKRFDRNRISKAKPDQRTFDRKNLPGKGSVRPKKEGSGPGNWGNPKDEAREATEKHNTEAEPKVEGETTPVEEVKKVEEKPAEPVDDTILYEDFLKLKKSTKKEGDENTAQLRANIKKDNLKIFQKEDETEISFAQRNNKTKSRKNKKEFVELTNVKVAENNRGSRPSRGPFKGGKGKVNVNDTNQFPEL